jgi:hypothetical protein
MFIPKPITMAIITFLFPMATSVGYWLKVTTVGEVGIAWQISILAFQIQKYFWSETDYREVKHFLFRGK